VIPLAEYKSAMLMEGLYPLRSGAGLHRRARAWPPARVVTDLVIVAYGGVVALLGALVHPSVVEAGADGAIEARPDPMIGGFVAALFVLLCILIANIDLRTLQTIGRSLRKLLACFAGALAIFALLAWSSRTSSSGAKGPVLIWLVLGSIVLAALHALVSRHLRASPAIRQLTARHIAIVCGHERTCARFLDLLRAQQDADIRLVGVFHDAADRRANAGAKTGRSLEALLAYAREGRVDEIFLALPWHAERRIASLVDRLAHLPADLKLCPDRVGYALAMVIGESLAGVPVATLHRQPMRGWGRVAKRALDVGASALLLFLLAPLLAGLALAIRLDSPGPALFRQPRQGFNDDLFELLKFRTMRHDPAAPFMQACVNDERVTAVGRWLRRTSLDELPQLINVLRGEMSLVGPRPHQVALNAAFMQHIRRYAARHRVKPGITGLAQVYGWRGETDTEDKMAGRIAHDLYYIENWSLMLDLKILALTLLTGFAHKNAY
jgi:Undecaprenyl-phosphate glucose phosphotransferase